METNNKIKDMFKAVEEKIEQRFGAQAGFKDVKAMLEGKAEKPDVRSMIMDSRAVFSGENKPQVLALKTVDIFKNEMDVTTGGAKAVLDLKKKDIAENMEKNMAIVENRSSNISYDIKKEDALFIGRFTGDEDVKPVAGIRVVIRGTDSTAKKVIAETVTDANGEYVIKMDKETIKKSPKNITISFETKSGESITKTKTISLTKAVGKVEKVDIKVPEDKKDLTKDILKGAKDRKYQAMIEITELKKAESELKLFEYKARTSSSELRDKLDEIKAIFEPVDDK